MAGRRSRGLRVLAAAAVLAATLVWWAPPAAADRVRDLQWHLQYLNIARAHELSQGEGITIAVIDTGVDGSHPDLEGNVLPGMDAWAAFHGEDPGDGSTDPNGHGTGMAGLIAAHGHGRGNAAGALGIAPKARIIPIRLPVELGLGGPEIHDAMTLAIKEALKLGADIISLSLTGPRGDQIKPILDAGKIVVVAGGNATDTEYPTATPGSVAVGAVRSDGLIADVSVRGRYAPPPLDELALGRTAGSGFIWLTAPGEDIVSPFATGGYATGTGTSASTAIVSGAAALVWSRYPELTGDQVVRHLLETTADKGATGPDVEYGYGDLDLVRALETEPSPPETTVPVTRCDPCVPSTLPTGEEATAAPESTSDGSGTDRTALAVAGAAAVVAAGSLALALVRRRPQQPAFAGPAPGPGTVPPPPPGPLPPPPGPPVRVPPPPGPAPAARPARSGKVLTAVAVVAMVVAVGAGIYAATQGGDGGTGSGGPATTTTELDRSGLPAGDPPTDPPSGIAELDELAAGCFAGTMADCDTLYWDAGEAISPEHPTAIDYVDYGSTCGGRVPSEVGLCITKLADS